VNALPERVGTGEEEEIKPIRGKENKTRKGGLPPGLP